jgi:hypothetical protein
VGVADAVGFEGRATDVAVVAVDLDNEALGRPDEVDEASAAATQWLLKVRCVPRR